MHCVTRSNVRHGNSQHHGDCTGPRRFSNLFCGVVESVGLKPTYQIPVRLNRNLCLASSLLSTVHGLKTLKHGDLLMDVHDQCTSNTTRQPAGRLTVYRLNWKRCTPHAFENDARWVIWAASRRQKWLDQGKKASPVTCGTIPVRKWTIYTNWRGTCRKLLIYLRFNGANGCEKTSTRHHRQQLQKRLHHPCFKPVARQEDDFISGEGIACTTRPVPILGTRTARACQ